MQFPALSEILGCTIGKSGSHNSHSGSSVEYSPEKLLRHRTKRTQKQGQTKLQK